MDHSIHSSTWEYCHCWCGSKPYCSCARKRPVSDSVEPASFCFLSSLHYYTVEKAQYLKGKSCGVFNVRVIPLPRSNHLARGGAFLHCLLVASLVCPLLPLSLLSVQ